MAKKHWIYVKRGLSEDPKHRKAMGIRIWLFMHMLDRADWETGRVTDWKDKDEADDMDLPWRTLQEQRQELEQLGYITCVKKLHGQDIIIHNWLNPKDYSGKVLNLSNAVQSTEISVLKSTVQSTEISVLKSTGQSTVKSTGHPIANSRTRSSNPSINGSMDRWMDDDPLCEFLMSLPGYNPARLETDRRVIGEKGYSLEALRYLWQDVQDGDNSIGLFLYRIGQGMQSPDFLAVLEQRRQPAQPAQPAGRRNGSSTQEPPIDTRPIVVVKSWPKAAEWWEATKGELALEMNKATFETWVKDTRVVDIERDVFAGKDGQGGVYVIGCPNEYSLDWLSKHLASTVNRILTGIHGAPWTVRFVTGRFIEAAEEVKQHAPK